MTCAFGACPVYPSPSSQVLPRYLRYLSVLTCTSPGEVGHDLLIDWDFINTFVNVLFDVFFVLLEMSMTHDITCVDCRYCLNFFFTGTLVTSTITSCLQIFDAPKIPPPNLVFIRR